MKILDIRGNLLKIESSEPINISTLLKVIDGENVYIAQVLYTESTHITNYVFAKIVACLDAPFIAVNIQNVSRDALCETINFSEVVSKLGDNVNIVAGELAFENYLLPAGKCFFDDRILIVSENIANTNLLISNFAHQIKHLGYNTIVFDTDGSFEGIRLTAGKDFKLPLNSHAIQFIYDKYFSDITEESKSVIKSIFDELKTYASTVPYIPFKSFKSVIDNVFDYSNNLGLFFFKNKLEKLYEADIFANTHEEVMDWKSLSEFGPATVAIDLSNINSNIFISEYISLILNSFKDTDIKLYSFIKLADNSLDKDFIKEVIENENVISSFVVPSTFRYLSVLKQNSASIIVFSGVKKTDNFDYCKFILKNLRAGEYVLTGNISAPYSIIFRLKEVTEVIPNEDDIPPESCRDENSENEEIEQNLSPVEEVNAECNTSDYEALPSIPDEDQEVLGDVIQDYEPVQEIQEAVDSTVPEAVEQQPLEDANLRELENNSDAVQEYNQSTLGLVDELVSESPNSVDEQIPELSDSIEVVPEESVVAVPEDNYEIPLEETSSLGVNELLANGAEEHYEEVPLEESFDIDINDNIEVIEAVDTEELEQQKSEDFVSAEQPEENQEVAFINEEVSLEEGMELVEEKLDDGLLPNDINQELVLDDSAEVEPELDLGVEEDIQLEEPEEKTQEELLDEEIRRDVDRMYTAAQPEDSESLSEDDLDFIEELVGTDDVIIAEDELVADNLEDSSIEVVDDEEFNNQTELPLEQDNISDNLETEVPSDDNIIVPQRNTATPAVPIYTAEIPEDAMVHSDPIQQGDRVMHVKFGVGVVEKIFSYGTKNFCSINFENIGRKVLDPNITELKKV